MSFNSGGNNLSIEIFVEILPVAPIILHSFGKFRHSDGEKSQEREKIQVRPPAQEADLRLEEVLNYRTSSCSKAKPYRKPYWDFPAKQGQKEDANCIYQEGMSILDCLFSSCFNRKSQLN